jgi:cyclophilin family peptidyl-prolyl cis-trans isomerase
LLVALLQLNQVDSALAILKGNPNAKIPRTPEAALRRSTPVVNAQMTDIQSKLEEVAYLLRIPQRKQWDKMQADIEACRDAIANQRPEIFRDVSESKEELVKETLEDVDTALQQMLRGITYKDSGYCGKYLNSALNSVSLIELSQVRSLPYSVPRSLANYPVLTGRAQVKFTIRSGSADRMFLFQDQELSQDPVGSFTVDLDGFTSPITSGQFLANVRNGLYSGTKVNEDYNQSSLITNVTSDPVTPPVAENDESSSKGYSNLPLEIFQTGEFEPSYNTTLDVLNMEYPVLPMSIYGAVVMCHDDTNGDSYKSSKDNFFIYKFDKSMGGLSGLSFEEGQFTVVGYVTAGSDLVQQIKSGDVIEKVEILSGEERLKEPFPPPRRALVVNDDVTTTTEEPEEGQQPVPNQPLVGENEPESA